MDHPITASELYSYQRDGFFVARGVFSTAEVDGILDAFMSANSNGPVEGLSEISSGYGDYTPDDPLGFFPRMMMPHLHDDRPVGPLAKKYLLEPRLYRYLRAFIGQDPVAVQSMFYFKPPKSRGQELHQDNYYLRVKPGTCMAAWIAIDDADVENGGMKVVPGSQEAEVVCPEQADSQTSFTTDYVKPPEGAEIVNVTMKAGDVLFFNGSLIHGSSPNISESRFRRALICHYVPIGSIEVAESYRQAMATFDGSIVDIAEATGGGPCGTSQPIGRH